MDEVYDIQYALDELEPKGLILCFLWSHDKHHPRDFRDPAAKNVWFANQLSDDACSSQAILNVLLNCRGVDLGPELKEFAADTEKMSPVVRMCFEPLHCDAFDTCSADERPCRL